MVKNQLNTVKRGQSYINHLSIYINTVKRSQQDTKQSIKKPDTTKLYIKMQKLRSSNREANRTWCNG